MDALHAWLAPDTSYKMHPIDAARYYAFIGHVWRDCRNLWAEDEARETIRQATRKLHQDWPDDLIQKIAKDRTSSGTQILDFLCALKDKELLNKLILE